MFTDGPQDALFLVVALLVVVAMLSVVVNRRAGRDIVGWNDLSLFTVGYWMLLAVAWLPTVGAAALGGVVAALVTWDPWPLAVVLVAGTLVGWLATLVYCLTSEYFDYFDTPGCPPDRRDQLNALLAWVVGPAVAGIVALVVVLAW